MVLRDASASKKTGCDKYVQDQLNLTSKNLAKYLFDEKIGKKYLEDICSMKGWSDKNAILNFFLALLYTPNFIFVRPPLHVFFFKITSQIFDKICETKYSF